MSDEVNFLHSDKHESLLQNDAMILLEFVKHSQSSQNGKFAMFLLYLRRKSKMKLIFLHADKHQIFLQGDTFHIDVNDQAF